MPRTKSIRSCKVALRGFPLTDTSSHVCDFHRTTLSKSLIMTLDLYQFSYRYDVGIRKRYVAAKAAVPRAQPANDASALPRFFSLM